MPHSLPPLMTQVAWSFAKGPFDTQPGFESALQSYQADVMDHSDWDPSELVLLSPRVIIQCDELQDVPGAQHELALSADNGLAFPAGELLYKVHRAMAQPLSDIDHHFFEGFSPAGERDGVPVFEIMLGS